MYVVIRVNVKKERLLTLMWSVDSKMKYFEKLEVYDEKKCFLIPHFY